MTIMRDYLNEKYSEEDDEYFERKFGVYHASGSGKCPRRRYFDFVEDTQVEARAYPHFELGNMIEDIFEDALIARYGHRYVVNGLPIEIPIDDFVLVGETDPVIINDNFEIRELWECKSTSNLSYTRDGPKRAHVRQVHAYMYGLKLFECNIIYVNKKNLRTQVHPVEFDPEIWAEIVADWRTVHEAIVNEEPPGPESDEDRQDHFCSHDARCCKNALDG